MASELEIVRGTTATETVASIPVISPYYKVQISSTKYAPASEGEEIRAIIPSSVSLSLSSEWSQFMNTGNKVAAIAVGTAELGGFTPRHVRLTSQVWQGNSPVELTIPFELRATYNAKKEVIDPILKLGKMVLPTTFSETNFLSPPGPRLFRNNQLKQTLTGTSEDGDIITLVIGDFMIFHAIIVTNVAIELFSIFDSEGYPMKANVSVTFRTMYALTSDELGNIIK